MTSTDHLFNVGGIVVEADTFHGTVAEWEARTPPPGPEWSVARSSNRIVAVRLLIPDELWRGRTKSAYEFPDPVYKSRGKARRKAK
jgi:hypothetical protein